MSTEQRAVDEPVVDVPVVGQPVVDEPLVDPDQPAPRPGGEAAPPSALERAIVEQLPDEAATAEAPRTVVPRWVQLALLPVAVLGLWVLATEAGKVLLVFVVAGVIALILNPTVDVVHRAHIPRGLAVLLVYLGFFLTVAAIGVLLANPISNQVSSFTRNLPHIVNDANAKLLSVQKYLNSHGVHVKFIKSGKTALQTLQDKLTKAGGSLVSFGGGLLTTFVSTALDIVIVFVLSIYMLVYGPRIGAAARRVMPPGDGSPADDYPTLVVHAVSSYVRGQALFSLIMGTTTAVALYLFGVLGIFPQGQTYAIAFGAFMGVMEFVPYIGPFLGALPPILVALFTNPISAIWVGLLFLGLQQLEGHIVAPQIFRISLRINPLLVIFALLVGRQIDGIVGAILALPILSILRETTTYLTRHLELERWDRGPGPLL